MSGESRGLLWYTGVIISLIAGAYYLIFFINHLSQLPEIEFNTNVAAVFVLTVAMYVSIIIIGGTVWYLLLRHYRQGISWANAQIIYGQSQFGKYIPGNIAHHVGRLMLSRKYGIPTQVALGSMFLEIIWAIAAGVVLAAVFSLGYSLPLYITEQLSIRFYSAVVVFLAAAFLPYLLLKIANGCVPSVSARLTVFKEYGFPGVKLSILIMLLSSMTFLVVGVVLAVHARTLFNVPDAQFLVLAGIFSLAWIAGFVTPGAPAGLGVRDAVLLAALTPLYGAGEAIGLSVILRIITTLGDGVWFATMLMASFTVRK